VQNDLNEFYAMIDFANPGLLGPLSAFKRIFAEPIEFSQDRTARWVVTVNALCTWIDLFCTKFIFISSFLTFLATSLTPWDFVTV